jgi:class 3 adenylate cyclase
VSQVAGGSLAAGREAIVRHDWSEAYERLREADAESPLGPEDLERLAEAAWWTAKLDECIAARERAFALYHGEGTRRAAALVAISLAKDYYAKGSSSIGAAWVNRAERLLADEPDCVEQGRLHRLRGVIALEVQDNYEVALEEARLARETAARFHDADLLAVALHDEGRALVMRGDVDAGMALIDEATAPATAGELTPFNTAVIYCNTITACKELADYRRAGEWSEAAKRWCERQAIAGFPGMCRVYRASIMALRGAWSEAEVEARLACEELPSFNRGYAAEAFYELGEIRLRSGDLPAAEEAFTHAHELGRDPQPGLARLRLVQGRIGGASTSLSRALDAEPGELHRARLLSAQVEVALTAGSAEAARAAGDELAAIAERYGSDALAAAAADGRARVGLAAGEAQAAGRAAREAVRLWQAVEAPYETAQARVVLGRIHASDGDDENARLELAAAAATFERLGARLDARGARDELARLRTGAGAPDGDARAMRTFLLTDIVRSTSLVEALGDEAWTDLVAWHDKTLRSLFAEHEGEEVDHAGDGFFVAFAAPRQALACAIAIQRRLAEQRREHGFAPQVRIGVHATEAVRHGNGYTGRGVHAAARIGALAGGAEILASRSTVDAAGLEEATQQTRTVALKGIEEPVEVVTLDWS